MNCVQARKFRGVGHDLICYQFSRYKVERFDFSSFLDSFAFDKLPTRRRLREMMDSFVFTIQGYENDEREIHSIPEVRSFYRAFHAAWPYWLYFCNLDDDGLKMMMFCRMDSFIGLKVDGRSEVKVEYDPLELLALLRADLNPMNQVCERAEMFEHLIEARTHAVFKYFGLPLS